MSAPLSLGWRMRRSFWTWWQTLRFKLNKPQLFGTPAPDGRTIESRPLGDVRPAIPLRRVRSFDRLPADESTVGPRLFIGATVRLTRFVRPMSAGLPGIDDDIDETIAAAVPRRYRKAFRAPVRPAAYEGTRPPDLGELAVCSPYALLLERDEDGALCWNFSELGRYEHHDGLCSLGLRVRFDADGPRLTAAAIESDEFGAITPGDDHWTDAARLAVCAAVTQTALTRHYNHIHLVGGDHWAVAARNHLPADHPLLRLLWPHIFNSLYTNDSTLRTQLLPDADFEHAFSYTHAGLMAYFDAMYERYDVRITDPDADWTRRGLDDTTFDRPTHDNLRELSRVMNDHAARYVDTYYADDGALRADPAVCMFVERLDELIPNGIGGLLGARPRADGLTRAGLARLIAGHIYEGSVVHDMAGTTLWDYQPWADHNPTRVYRDGRAVPVDVYQRMINNNFALQIRRAPLLADYGAVALDERGRELFARFLSDCTALQGRYDQARAGPWRMEPRNLEIGMNA